MRIGGVPEHFSLPFYLAKDHGEIPEVTFVAQPGGTGEMVKNLANGDLDVAVALTEGLVLAIDTGALKNVKIVSVFVESPLQWGIHVNGKSKVGRVGDLDSKTCRIAISRFLSGSHLMSWVFAKEHGWDVDHLKFVQVGGLSGALKAFEEDRVDLFLWDRFMTQPVCKDGHLKQIGSVNSPWPCFCVAARQDVLDQKGAELDRVLKVVLQEGRKLRDNVAGSVAILHDRFRLSEEVAREWLDNTVYAESVHPLDQAVAAKIREFIPKPE